MRDYFLDSECRTAYVKLMIGTLVDKYHVNKSSLARGMGIHVNYMSDFMTLDRVASPSTLDKIENYLNDLYGNIITDEELNNYGYIEELKFKSMKTLIQKQEEEDARKKRKKRRQKNTTR